MFDLDWNMIVQSRGLLMTGMWLTLQVTLVAILAGLGFGIVLAAMSTVKVPVLNWLAKMYVSLFRSIPLVMLLLWFFLIVPQVLKSVLNISPSVDIRLISAMVAFSLLEAAFFCEIIRAGIQSLPAGQFNAAKALGMSWAQSMRLIILPQAFRKMLPVTLTQCIVIFQDTSLVYVIALGDFFSRAKSVGERDGTLIQMLLFAGLTYWVICSLATMIVKFVQGRVKYD